MNEQHELMIQRLVDNELDEQARAEFLRQAEVQPELWRQATLSFVEDRVWSAVVRGAESTRHKTNQPAAASHRAGTENVVSTRTKPWWFRYGPQLMMTAASVLFVLTLALRFNPVAQNGDPAAGSDVASSQTDVQPGDSIDPLEPPLGPRGSQFASEPYRVRMNDMEVPVYDDPQRFQQEILKAGELDPAVLQRFRDAGLQIQPDFRYIAGQLPDGRSVFMPVQSFRVQRIGQ